MNDFYSIKTLKMSENDQDHNSIDENPENHGTSMNNTDGVEDLSPTKIHPGAAPPEDAARAAPSRPLKRKQVGPPKPGASKAKQANKVYNRRGQGHGQHATVQAGTSAQGAAAHAHQPEHMGQLMTSYNGMQYHSEMNRSYADVASWNRSAASNIIPQNVGASQASNDYIPLSQVNRNMFNANVSVPPNTPSTSRRANEPNTPSASRGATPSKRSHATKSNQNRTSTGHQGSSGNSGQQAVTGQARGCGSGQFPRHSSPVQSDYVPLQEVNARRPTSLDLGYAQAQSFPQSSANAQAQPNNQSSYYWAIEEEEEPEDDITVNECLAMKGEDDVGKNLTCYVIELEPPHAVHPQVSEIRRKICVGDETGVMYGYIKRQLPVSFDKGDSIRIRNFGWRDTFFLIHGNTFISHSVPVILVPELVNRGQVLYCAPQNPIVPIRRALRSEKGQLVSVTGKVTTTEKSRVVGKLKDRLVKSVTLKDSTGEIKSSLWGTAANKCDIELGMQITLIDANLQYAKNNKRACDLNVNHADQVIIEPPKDLEEFIRVLGVEESERYKILIFDVVNGKVSERLTIDRYYLTDVLGGREPVTVRHVINYLPFSAIVNIKGQKITQMRNIKISPKAAARLMNQTPSHNVGQNRPPSAASGSADHPYRGSGHDPSGPSSGTPRSYGSPNRQPHKSNVSTRLDFSEQVENVSAQDEEINENPEMPTDSAENDMAFGNGDEDLHLGTLYGNEEEDMDDGGDEALDESLLDSKTDDADEAETE